MKSPGAARGTEAGTCSLRPPGCLQPRAGHGHHGLPRSSQDPRCSGQVAPPPIHAQPLQGPPWMSVKEEPLFTEPLLCASYCQAPHTRSHLILTMPDETGARRVNQLVQSHPAPDLNPGLLALASAPTTLLREVLPQPHCLLGAGGWQRGLGRARPACGLLRPWAPDERLPSLQGLPLRLLVSRLEVGTGSGAGREG